ncbi:unnamed protein product [Meganyctiphanes norvegica]|uniref:Cyclophilin E n=1 Tax=Meganyctiphanes norvegica TaxID=48144 RepID=A0AAV2PNQ7_MEGNR
MIVANTYDIMSDTIKTFKIFCGNLSGDATHEDLHYLFSAYGPVVEAVVMKGKFYGFVHMEHEGDGWRAICNLRGHKLKGKAMAVEPSINSKRVNPLQKQNIIGQGMNNLDDFDDFEFSMEHTEDYVEEEKRETSPILKTSEILPISEPCNLITNSTNTILPPPGLGSPPHFPNNSDCSSINHSSLNPSLNSGSSTSSPLPDNSLSRAIEEDLLLNRKSPQLFNHRQSPFSLQPHQKFPLFTAVDANSNSISSSQVSSKKDWSICSLCCTCYDDWQHKPKILSCGHTFCCDCLISLASATEVKCPSGCSYTTSLTEAGISGLTTNYTVPFKKSEELRSTPSPIMPPTFSQHNGSSSKKNEVCCTCLKSPPLISCSTNGHKLIGDSEAWELLGGQMRELLELVLQQLRTAMTMRAAMKDRLQSTLTSVEKFGEELRRKVEGEEMEEVLLQEQLADLTQANEVLREPRGSIQSLLDNFKTVHTYSSIIPTTYTQCHAITAINNATEAINITLKPSSLNTLSALGFSSEEAFAMTSSLEQHAMCGNNANVVLLYMLSDLLASRMIQLTSIGASSIPSFSPALSSKPPPPPGLLPMSPRHIVDSSIIAHNKHGQSRCNDMSLNVEDIVFKVTEAIETGTDLPPIGSPDVLSGFSSCTDSNITPTITSFMSLGLSNLKILASDEKEESDQVEKSSEKDSFSSAPSSSFAEAAKKPAKPTPKIPVNNVTKPSASISKTGKFPNCWMSVSINGINVGRIIFELRPDKAPKMCENFLGLCISKPGYGYKGCHFFKSGDGILAGGDVEHDDGTGGYSIYDKKPFEADLCPLKDEVGMVRFKGAGTSDTGRGMVGSQFMIWCTDREFKKFAFSLVFGKVIDGLEVAKKASSVNVHRTSVIIEDCGTV